MRRMGFAAALVVLSIVLTTPAVCDNPPAKPFVSIFVPNIVDPNQKFEISLTLSEPSKTPVTVKMSESAYLSYSKTQFNLVGNNKETIMVTPKPTKLGLGWVHAIVLGNTVYDDGYVAINMGFKGHLKASNKAPVPYGQPGTLSFSIVDVDGNPLPFDGELEVRLESSDAKLRHGAVETTPLPLTLPAGSRSTPQFQITSTEPSGGDLHVSAALYVKGVEVVLTQEELVVAAQPAWWLLLLLAVLGGLLHAAYKIARMPFDTSHVLFSIASVVATSAVAGIVAYVFADFDLLGFKLDPNVLRTYPAVGFLFAYFGFDLVLADKFPTKRKGEAEPPKEPPKTEPPVEEKALEQHA